jgi:putative oxidoreductase
MHSTPQQDAAKGSSLMANLVHGYQRITKGLSFLAPIGDLAIRLWVANVFWKSGLTKFQSWESTLLLFNYEYEVPLLPPEVAAYLGTTIELLFPVLLALGLAGRFSAGVLFLFNIMAVMSYPGLNEAGFIQHQAWGIMLLIPLLHGPGKLSIDHWLGKRVFYQYKRIE